MRICLVDDAFDDLTYWSETDRKTHARILRLLKEISRTPFEGIGKPEPLKENLKGFWSRRIDETNRIVYTVERNDLIIISCRNHY